MISKNKKQNNKNKKRSSSTLNEHQNKKSSPIVVQLLYKSFITFAPKSRWGGVAVFMLGAKIGLKSIKNALFCILFRPVGGLLFLTRAYNGFHTCFTRDYSDHACLISGFYGYITWVNFGLFWKDTLFCAVTTFFCLFHKKNFTKNLLEKQ